MSKGMIAALFVSIVLAVALSLLPDDALLDRLGSSHVTGGLETQRSERDVPVAGMSGMVDRLGALSLTNHLHKVVWEQDKLTVWLAVPAKSIGQKRPYEDIYKIAHRFLVSVPDYREVEVRVVTSERPEQVAFAVLAGAEFAAERSIRPGKNEAD